MTVDLHTRSYRNVVDFTPEELTSLLDLAAQLKEAKGRGREVMALRGKNIALIFEKTSTRTRCAFEVAAYDQGAHVTYLGPDGSQIGHKESIKDTARVLGRTALRPLAVARQRPLRHPHPVGTDRQPVSRSDQRRSVGVRGLKRAAGPNPDRHRPS